MPNISSSDSTVAKDYTESPLPSNKHTGKITMSDADFMKLLSKESYDTRKIEQQRQDREAIEMNQNQSFKFQDNSSGHKKDYMLNPPYDETRNVREMKKKSRRPRKYSNEIPTVESTFSSDVSSTVGLYSQAEHKIVHRRPRVNHQAGPQEMQQQETNTKSASSAWISDAVTTKRSGKKHQEKEVQFAMAPKATKDRHHARRNAKYAAEFKSLEARFVPRKNLEPEDFDVESDRNQQFETFVKNSAPVLSEIKASFQLTRDRATTAIKNSQIARAEATKVILESQAVRARIEKALVQRLAAKSYAESAERGGLSRETSAKTVIASSVDGSVEDILEMDKNNNKEIAGEKVQEAVQSAEKAVQKAVQFQDRTVQPCADSPQTSNSLTNTMESNTKNTDGEAATKVSKYTWSMENYKIEFVTEAEDDAEKAEDDAENAEDDWVEVMDYDEDEDEVEEDGWLLA
ncbi:uncharacterized protein Bfra_004234 [Botrytis fragariae]|uniref:Uncharacterized protein n=1 Tax=Botrytis fragariae TaxID=1964551 RepID=A0A8H6AV99_9HELO|nr:uncharacterized protein Bfra_004234 [Botrytis fragariae]KAF5874228.1 hypothetical protein Bfra_004234 [Botrytis fragariae]